MDQVVLEPEPEILDVGTGAKKFRWLELEPEPPEIWVPAPQPWSQVGNDPQFFKTTTNNHENHTHITNTSLTPVTRRPRLVVLVEPVLVPAPRAARTTAALLRHRSGAIPGWETTDPGAFYFVVLRIKREAAAVLREKVCRKSARSSIARMAAHANETGSCSSEA